MDAVDKYEDRTVWGQGQDLTAKFGSTRVTLRARPPGGNFASILHHIYHCALLSTIIPSAVLHVTVLHLSLSLMTIYSSFRIVHLCPHFFLVLI